ncbi:AraC family transcriptional regulator [Spirosoma sp. 209]|uniref:helix-turn-helix transcriptional regulator n=1 Tax=Spirosoma sp. 209 TaxID=1955701 RepID=UPI00098D03DE|nr:AraC family transcriptional regulator [Spirosoma sp. 209]
MKYVSEIYTRPALVTSETLAWQGVRVERYQLEAMELPPHYHEQHLLMLHQMDAPVLAQRQKGSQLQQAVFRTGDLGLYPGGEYGRVAWTGPADTIHLSIDGQHLERLARQGMDIGLFSLHDRFQFEDALLSELGRQLLNAVGTQHALGLLYVESLTNALCYHLIEHHATCQPRTEPGRRLPEAVLHRIDAYLEARADQPVTLDVLAGLANLSVFHFARLFKRTTGQSPYQYVIGWKIRQACQLLQADMASITDISDALGFNSSTQFSVAFKRAMGVSPRAFRRGQAR